MKNILLFLGMVWSLNVQGQGQIDKPTFNAPTQVGNNNTQNNYYDNKISDTALINLFKKLDNIKEKPSLSAQQVLNSAIIKFKRESQYTGFDSYNYAIAFLSNYEEHIAQWSFCFNIYITATRNFTTTTEKKCKSGEYLSGEQSKAGKVKFGHSFVSSYPQHIRLNHSFYEAALAETAKATVTLKNGERAEADLVIIVD